MCIEKQLKEVENFSKKNIFRRCQNNAFQQHLSRGKGFLNLDLAWSELFEDLHIFSSSSLF
jgi:hypothetical protein